LSRFGITSYFIGDRDNVVDYGLLSQTDLAQYYKKAKSYFPKAQKKLGRGSHYNKLVLVIKDLYPAIYNQLLGRIRELHAQQIFLLEK
jgi:hypothetical protein